MQALLLESTGGFTVVDIHEFHDILDNLKVGCFDIVRLQIGSNPEAVYDIYCDDEGLLKDNPIVTAFGKNLEPLLVGNLLIAQSNAYGEQVAFTNEDITYIRQFCLRYRVKPVHSQRGKLPEYVYCIVHSDYAGRR